MKIQFNYLTKVNIRNRTKLKVFIELIFKQEDTKLETLTYVFCTDPYLLDINKQYLNHNHFTDIITFDLSNKPNDPKIGEIYISIDTVKQNANEYKTSFTNELHRVIFHGALHLCGYKDKEPADFKLMKQKEDFYLKRFF